MFYTTSISILKNKKQSTSLEKQKNILCYHEVKNNNDVYIYYKAIYLIFIL